MEATPIIVAVIGFVAIIAFLAYRGDKHAQEIQKIKDAQQKAQAGISRLDNSVAAMSVAQDNYDYVQEQATRLLHEQIGMKMDAMTACRDMLRGTGR